MDLIRQSLLLILSAILLTFSFIHLSVQASSNVVDFSVQAKIPSNQLDKMKSYFDLKMRPGQKQDIEVVVFNNSPKVETIVADVTFATTNDNGLIDYSPKSVNKADKSLSYPLINIVDQSHKEIVIPARKSKIIKFSLKMPNQKYDGVLLGAVHFKKKIEKSDKKTPSETIQIKNQYAYVIGVKLTETMKQVSPDLHLIKIQPKLVNYHTAIAANIQNSEAVIVEKMKINASITKKGSNKVLYSTNKTGLSMAPNSNFDYAIDLDNQPIVPGTYRLKMKAVIGEEIWEWDELFEIGNEAKNLNNKAVEVKHEYIWLYVGVGIFFLILGILLFLFTRKRKKEKEKRIVPQNDKSNFNI